MIKATLDNFKQLRVYRRLTLPLLFNDMLCNRIMKLNSLVNYAPRIYQLSCNLFGKNFVNSVLHSTYCKVFTAGNTIKEANEMSEFFRTQGIPVILDYCAQGDIHNPDLEANLQKNATLFAESARLSAQQQNEMISIKITGLLDMRVLKKWNQSVEWRDSFWQKNKNVSGNLTFNRLVEGFRSLNENITRDDITEYIKLIHKFQGQAQNFNVSQIDFKINHQPYYLFEAHKNNNRIIREFFPLQPEERVKVQSFAKRVKFICEPQAQNRNNFRILVDAEQSYVQKAIEVISEQLQERYNRQRAYIIPTIQNYLKRSVQRGLYEIKMAKHKNLKFGAKLVRGAYIVEETRLANTYGYENPVSNTFDDTTTNYLTNFKAILDNFSQGEVIVATHNQDTLNEALRIRSAHPNPPTVSFAQLLGLADHLTFQLKSYDLPVYKYLPWAQTQVMVPYMIRRAQELNQMKYPLDLQYQLLKDELWTRLKYQS